MSGDLPPWHTSNKVREDVGSCRPIERLPGAGKQNRLKTTTPAQAGVVTSYVSDINANTTPCSSKAH